MSAQPSTERRCEPHTRPPRRGAARPSSGASPAVVWRGPAVSPAGCRTMARTSRTSRQSGPSEGPQRNSPSVQTAPGRWGGPPAPGTPEAGGPGAGPAGPGSGDPGLRPPVTAVFTTRTRTGDAPCRPRPYVPLELAQLGREPVSRTSSIPRSGGRPWETHQDPPLPLSNAALRQVWF